MTPERQAEIRSRMAALRPEHFEKVNDGSEDPWDQFADHGPQDVVDLLAALAERDAIVARVRAVIDPNNHDIARYTAGGLVAPGEVRDALNGTGIWSRQDYDA